MSKWLKKRDIILIISLLLVGIIALVIMVLLFPLFLLDKQFPYDMQRINSNDT